LLISNLIDDKALPIYGDGKQERDWLHVQDHCRALIAVLERGRVGEVYNIGGLEIVENIAMARTLLNAMNKPESLLTYVKDRPGHDRRYALDCKKIASELGWKPQISIELGLRQTIDWYIANTKWIAGVRDGDYLTYYDKYYKNRDTSLNALTPSKTKIPT
jgi:dTDP-glucose 4,6-dehydratase